MRIDHAPPPTHDRGLDLARERYRLHLLLGECAAKYDVASALEGPLDGVDGVRGVHGFGLARRGVQVVSAVASEEEAVTARGVYAGAGDTRVIVADVRDASQLPMSDLVLSYDALAIASDWRAYVRGVASRARKVFVLVARNPDSIASIARRLPFAKAPAAIPTRDVAQVLWEIGRVREHVHFGFQSRSSADRFEFGPGRWVQLGGAGCDDRVARAVQEASIFEDAPTRIRTRAAKLHAFVVDLSPRTPQARKRLLRTVS